MSPSYQAVIEQYERFRVLVSNGEKPDFGPLFQAVRAHFRNGVVQLSEVGPCVGVLWFKVFECDGRWNWLLRPLLRVLRLSVFRGRPLWNDFHMILWQLSRRPYYAQKLYDHLRNSNEIQRVTGRWMIASVCQQDPEFHRQWNLLLAQRGEIS